MNIAALSAELTSDTLARGYAGMNDEAVAIDLNTVYRETNKSSMSGSEVANAMNKAEFDALSDTDKRTIWDVLHLGSINPFGIEADIFTSVFGNESATIVALAAARKNDVSRATELGLGVVGSGHVGIARAG